MYLSLIKFRIADPRIALTRSFIIVIDIAGPLSSLRNHVHCLVDPQPSCARRPWSRYWIREFWNKCFVFLCLFVLMHFQILYPQHLSGRWIATELAEHVPWTIMLLYWTQVRAHFFSTICCCARSRLVGWQLKHDFTLPLSLPLLFQVHWKDLFLQQVWVVIVFIIHVMMLWYSSVRVDVLVSYWHLRKVSMFFRSEDVLLQCF